MAKDVRDSVTRTAMPARRATACLARVTWSTAHDQVSLGRATATDHSCFLYRDREFSVATKLSISQKKKYPWDLGHHILVSEHRYTNT